MGAPDLFDKIALTALLPLGILMLAIGLEYDGSDPDQLIPAFRLREKFAVVLGDAFAKNDAEVRKTCRVIGTLKIMTVFNMWWYRNAKMMAVLAGIAVPSFALVVYAHAKFSVQRARLTIWRDFRGEHDLGKIVMFVGGR